MSLINYGGGWVLGVNSALNELSKSDTVIEKWNSYRKVIQLSKVEQLLKSVTVIEKWNSYRKVEQLSKSGTLYSQRSTYVGENTSPFNFASTFHCIHNGSAGAQCNTTAYRTSLTTTAHTTNAKIAAPANTA